MTNENFSQSVDPKVASREAIEAFLRSLNRSVEMGDLGISEEEIVDKVSSEFSADVNGMIMQYAEAAAAEREYMRTQISSEMQRVTDEGKNVASEDKAGHFRIIVHWTALAKALNQMKEIEGSGKTEPSEKG